MYTYLVKLILINNRSVKTIFLEIMHTALFSTVISVEFIIFNLIYNLLLTICMFF